jgi:hypothetical protein
MATVPIHAVTLFMICVLPIEIGFWPTACADIQQKLAPDPDGTEQEADARRDEQRFYRLLLHPFLDAAAEVASTRAAFGQILMRRIADGVDTVAGDAFGSVANFMNVICDRRCPIGKPFAGMTLCVGICSHGETPMVNVVLESRTQKC